MEYELTMSEKIEDAKSAFERRAIELGDTNWETIAGEAWQNAFSVKCSDEYRDDLHRWEVALATLEMFADQGRAS